MSTIFESSENVMTGPKHLKASEIQAFGEALKQPEFRAMLVDYVKEVSDPDNQKLFRKEMAALEAEQGYHVTFLTPKPGYVIKTRAADNNQEKVFINVCSDENIGDASCSAPVAGNRIPWALPYSTSKPRVDLDKSGASCTVYDVLFNPNVIAKAEKERNFRDMVNATALEGLEKAFGVKLDLNAVKFPKLKFKGSVHTTVIRKKLHDPAQDEEEQQLQEPKNNEVCKTKPKFDIKFRYNRADLPAHSKVSDPCRPSEMVIDVHLPKLTSAQGIDLDVLEYLITLESEEYKLVLKLPYPVFDDQGQAKFDKSKHALQITLPVKAKELVSRLISTDSGIELEFDDDQQAAPADFDKAQEDEDEEDRDEGMALDQGLPPFTSHIYDGLMVLTINVRNVVADSLKKAVLQGHNGYQLSFHSLGEGLMPFRYGFCLAFDFGSNEGKFCNLEDLEVEVWDNNMILQLSLPKDGCSAYRVGTSLDSLGEATALPQLKAAKEKCYQLGKKDASELDSDDSLTDSRDFEEDKERHSSGESHDSAMSCSPLKRFQVSKVGPESLEGPRGILKRSRCFSEPQVVTDFINGKKSVRFNEVVQRQVYRSNSSILGQKAKNLKKAEQKRRKAAEKRRLSEGDASSFMSSCPEDSEAEVNDSGVASSLDEAAAGASKNSVKSRSKKVVKKSSKKAPGLIDSDLIFNLDF